MFTVDPEEYKKEIVSDIVSQINISKNSPSLSRLMTRKETSAYLRIALSTLWKLTKSNQIQAVYIGNRVFYKQEEVERALVTLK